MPHIDWKAIAEQWRERMQERCQEEGHVWEQLPGFGDACRWCDALAFNIDQSADEDKTSDDNNHGA